MQLDRSRLFALLGALEEDLRNLIERYPLSIRTEEQVLGPAFDKAFRRFSSDGDRHLAESTVLDYLDLGDEVQILNRWRSDLPAQTGESLAANSAELGDLVPIRNRVAHRRPLLPDDFEKAERVLVQLEWNGFEGPTLREELRRAREDPQWAPAGPGATSGARTLNNLPLGDYDETGLVGRRRELDKLASQLRNLSSSRSPVLTVVGPGGIGKTALVLQALHDLVNDDECPYDLVSWVSLKTERLTARGVQNIRDAVLNVDQAMPALIEALQPDFKGTMAQLADSLDGLTTLIVIDNLETVSGREVVELVDSLPEQTSYLFTSREGLGELERRFPLGPLEDGYAVDLFRRMARARGLESHAQMGQSAALGIVRQLGASPLGLKWFVSNLELGKDPLEIVRHREDLVRFCVANVFESLDHGARRVATVVHVLARPATVPEIRLYIPDISADELRTAIQSLDRRMLVRRDLLAGSISETFEASESLSDYLRIAGVVDAAEAKRIREVDDTYRLAEERHRLDAVNDPLRPNIVQGGVEHRASVLLLRDALSQSKRGDVEEALGRLREAESLDPEFWEIHRVRGFILSSAGIADEATASYVRAIDLAPTEEAAAAVKFFFAGHLTRVARDSERALPLAREAHAVLESERTAVELGRVLTYLGDFEAAESALGEALGAGEVRTRLIALTQLADTMKRRAEAELTVDRLPGVALSTLSDAVDLTAGALEEGLVDSTLVDKVVSLASEMLSVAASCREEASVYLALNNAMSVVDRLGTDARRARSFDYLVGHGRRLLSGRPEIRENVPSLSTFIGRDESPASAGPTEPAQASMDILGKIKVWKPERHFGFIASIMGDEDFFFIGHLLRSRVTRYCCSVRCSSDSARLTPRMGEWRLRMCVSKRSLRMPF